MKTEHSHVSLGWTASPIQLSRLGLAPVYAHDTHCIFCSFPFTVVTGSRAYLHYGGYSHVRPAHSALPLMDKKRQGEVDKMARSAV